MLIEGFISSQPLHTSATAPLSKAESHFTATAAYHPAASLRNSSVAKGRESNSAAAQQSKDKGCKNLQGIPQPDCKPAKHQRG
ncbi:hypothetical protein Nepgr_009254 [Nepenthes gracilis]|uniref:Uncharacterized protein n=1 Tax=Nepenthes gracilis TaxID=150966 RepID=A0AAD3SAT2_NEPGR|nr:hypothetical protein Nepgr_009254 [Nepenthes gracilis]